MSSADPQPSRLDAIGQAARRGERVDAEELREIVETLGDDPWDLLSWADRVRRAHHGRRVRYCCIVPGRKSGCGGDCKWCAQGRSGPDAGQAPQATPPEEIHAAVNAARACSAAALGVVNSGLRPSEAELQAVCESGREIRNRTGNIPPLCASLGMISPEQARRLAEAGYQRYHHNLETSRRFFPQVVTSHGYDQKLATLDAARQAGLEICCGGLFGLGETWADRFELAETLRDRVQPHAVPLNFLHAIPGTVLADRPPMPPMEILTTVAAYRLLMPTVDIKVAGGRETNLRDLQSWVFFAGATSIMTGGYLTTAGRSAAEDRRMIEDLGLELE